MSKKGQPKSINPLAVIFKFLQNKSRVEIWLYDNVDIRLEGKILGFDEFMNIVLDETFEIKTKTKTSRPLGKLLVKGENVTLIRAVTENVWFLSYTHYRSALRHKHINSSYIIIPTFPAGFDGTSSQLLTGNRQGNCLEEGLLPFARECAVLFLWWCRNLWLFCLCRRWILRNRIVRSLLGRANIAGFSIERISNYLG